MSTDTIVDTTDATPMCMRDDQCPSQKCNINPTTAMGECAKRTVQQRWGNISCIDGEIEKHDGRIKPVFE